jgi:hypothetical protein
MGGGSADGVWNSHLPTLRVFWNLKYWPMKSSGINYLLGFESNPALVCWGSLTALTPTYYSLTLINEIMFINQ